MSAHTFDLDQCPSLTATYRVHALGRQRVTPRAGPDQHRPQRSSLLQTGRGHSQSRRCAISRPRSVQALRGPCRPARTLPFSAHGVAYYRSIGEAARRHRALQPDPRIEAPGRTAVDSRNQTRRLPPDRRQAGRQSASFHAPWLRLDRAIPAHQRGRGGAAAGIRDDRRGGGLLRRGRRGGV